MEFITRLFDPSGFPARWQCGSGWAATPWLGWLHILSDLGVWSAYVAIPLVLGYFLLRRKDLPFRKIFLLFGAFILACGTTHLMEAIIFWWPVYRLAGVIKLLTAIVSWTTVFSLFRVVPGVLTMRSPEELEREIAARKRVEGELQRVNVELERHATQVQTLATELTQAEQQERRRLAQIPHDELQQLLVAAGMMLETVELDVTDKPSIKIITTVKEMLGRCADESRSLSHQLSPPILHDCGLLAALHWLVEEQQKRYGLTVVLTTDIQTEPTDEALRTILFHAVRELLFNTVKHARVKQAAVNVTATRDGKIQIEVRDMGPGFDSKRLTTSDSFSGFGLRAIRDRLQLFGGNMDVITVPGQGTQITLTAPFQNGHRQTGRTQNV